MAAEAVAAEAVAAGTSRAATKAGRHQGNGEHYIVPPPRAAAACRCRVPLPRAAAACRCRVPLYRVNRLAGASIRFSGCSIEWSRKYWYDETTT